MRIPFYHLPLALTEIKAHYPDYVIERESMFADYFGAVKKCKLFDVDSGKWLPYTAAAVAAARNAEAMPSSAAVAQ